MGSNRGVLGYQDRVRRGQRGHFRCYLLPGFIGERRRPSPGCRHGWHDWRAARKGPGECPHAQAHMPLRTHLQLGARSLARACMRRGTGAGLQSRRKEGCQTRWAPGAPLRAPPEKGESWQHPARPAAGDHGRPAPGHAHGRFRRKLARRPLVAMTPPHHPGCLRLGPSAAAPPLPGQATPL